MIYKNRSDFLKISVDGRLIGLDVGSKTIGVAVSDTTRTVASPYKTINRKKFSEDIKILLDIVKSESASGVIVGLPVSMDGSQNKTSQSIHQFGQNLLKEFDIPLLFWDERFSTIAAERALLEADMSRQKRSEVIDKMAASYILQGFLDSIKG